MTNFLVNWAANLKLATEIELLIKQIDIGYTMCSNLFAG